MPLSPFIFQLAPSSGVPIYRQLMEQINRMTASQQIKAGDYLPSVRQLATELDVNPMTISKAYGLLEAQGTLKRVRGKGMVVVESTQKQSIEHRLNALNPLVNDLIKQCQQLDIDQDQVLNWLKEQFKKEWI
ncbi:GntR family transcriptional regulator [Neptunicella sp.]|uniref:GntR family transcriptional regulator n=1 Tax=Neptunicella sp. TaxID=2125986 RepID=UPI003F690515